MRKLLAIMLPAVALAAGATPSAYAAGFDTDREYENCITRAIRAQAHCGSRERLIENRGQGQFHAVSDCQIQFDDDKAQCDRERAWAEGDRRRDWRREID